MGIFIRFLFFIGMIIYIQEKISFKEKGVILVSSIFMNKEEESVHVNEEQYSPLTPVDEEYVEIEEEMEIFEKKILSEVSNIQSKDKPMVTIKIAHPYKGTEVENWLKSMTDKYKEKNKKENIEIEIVTYNKPFYKDKIYSMINGEQLDIVFLEEDRDSQTLMSNYVFLEIDDVVMWAGLSLYMSDYGPIFQYNQHSYGIPIASSGSGFYYWKDVFKKHQLKTPSKIEDIWGICQSLDKDTEINPMGFSLNDETLSLFLSYIMIRKDGISSYLSFKEEEEVIYNNDIFKEVLSSIVTLQEKACFSSEYTDSIVDMKTQFYNKEVAMILDMGIDYPFSDEKKDQIGFFRFPYNHFWGDKHSMLLNIDGAHILRSSKNIKESKSLLKEIYIKSQKEKFSWSGKYSRGNYPQKIDGEAKAFNNYGVGYLRFDHIFKKEIKNFFFDQVKKMIVRGDREQMEGIEELLTP